MPAVMRLLLGSPLADRYRFDVIATYRDARPLPRLLIFLRALGALALWCARPGLRIVHVHMAARGSMYRKPMLVAVAKALRRPVILQVHAGSGDLTEFLARLGPLRRAALRAAFSASDRVVSVSSSSAEALRSMLGDVEVSVVPNPPPESSPAPSVISRRPRSESDEVTILYLGGFANQVKGGAILLAAIERLLDLCPSAQVELAGPGECPQRALDRVRWRGWLDSDEKNAAFAEADIFVLPSTSEGLPIALLEAMVRGLPIVATKVGGVPEVLTDGLDAFLVDPGRAEQLATALAELARDPGRRQALGMAAAERARRLADEDVFGALDRLYADVIS